MLKVREKVVRKLRRIDLRQQLVRSRIQTNSSFSPDFSKWDTLNIAFEVLPQERLKYPYVSERVRVRPDSNSRPIRQLAPFPPCDVFRLFSPQIVLIAFGADSVSHRVNGGLRQSGKKVLPD